MSSEHCWERPPNGRCRGGGWCSWNKSLSHLWSNVFLMFWTLLNAPFLQFSHELGVADRKLSCSRATNSPRAVSTAYQMGKSTKRHNLEHHGKDLSVLSRRLHVSFWKSQGTGGNLSIFRYQKMTLQKGCEIVHLGESRVACVATLWRSYPNVVQRPPLGPDFEGEKGIGGRSKDLEELAGTRDPSILSSKEIWRSERKASVSSVQQKVGGLILPPS